MKKFVLCLMAVCLSLAMLSSSAFAYHRGCRGNNWVGPAIVGGAILGTVAIIAGQQQQPVVVQQPIYVQPPPRMCYQTQHVLSHQQWDPYSGRYIWVRGHDQDVPMPCYR